MFIAAWASATPLWETELSRLSVSTPERRSIDGELRRALHLPDTRHVLVVQAAEAQGVLAGQSALLPTLRNAVAEGRLGDFQAAAALLPTAVEQAARQAWMPSGDVLRRRLEAAADGLAVRAQAFSPFVDDVAAQKVRPPLDVEGFAASPAAPLTVLPWRLDDGWAGVIPLMPPIDLATKALAPARVVDLSAVAGAVVADWRDEALRWLALGAAAALVLLAAVLRRPRAIVRAILPPTTAVVTTAAILVASGTPLSIFHILGLLLVASIGVDYALFFTGYSAANQAGLRSLYSIALCSATTVTVFGVLSLSALPVLSAIGTTVAIGSAMSLALTLFMTDG